jgi:AMMECR1 domain-containing protein
VNELSLISIEISRLTAPVMVKYSNVTELPGLLHPNIDGVILRDGMNRATFLPQVWAQLPDTGSFLSNLCQKMGAAPDLWRHKILDVSIYHVEEFCEDHR